MNLEMNLFIRDWGKYGLGNKIICIIEIFKILGLECRYLSIRVDYVIYINWEN